MIGMIAARSHLSSTMSVLSKYGEPLLILHSGLETQTLMFFFSKFLMPTLTDAVSVLVWSALAPLSFLGLASYLFTYMWNLKEKNNAGASGRLSR